MILKVKKINEDAILPYKAHNDDAGFDLFSVEEATLKPFERKLIHTGLTMELPKDTEAQVRPRSGLALKHGISVLNTPGTVDEGYRGEIAIILINLGSEDFVITKGMKIAQMVIKKTYDVEIKEVEVLSETGRGAGGFGSTGTK